MTIKKTMFLIFILPLIVGTIYLSRHIIVPFIIGFFLAYALNPIVEFLQDKGARRDWAILSVYLVLLIIGAMVLELLIPQLIKDLNTIIQRLPMIIQDLHLLQQKVIKGFDGLNLPFKLSFIGEELSKQGENIIRNLFSSIGRKLTGFFSQSLLYLLVPLIAYYISRDYPRNKEKIFNWICKHFGSHWTKTFQQIDLVFKYYIRGQLLDTLIVGVLLALGLSVMGLEGAILLGFIAAIFNLIPYFGPVIGAIPLIILALLKSPWLVLYVILLFLVVNQLEVMILSPRIMSYSLGLHPVTVIFLILLGGEIFGLMGMIFAVPLGAIFLILIKSFYEINFETANHDPIE